MDLQNNCVFFSYCGCKPHRFNQNDFIELNFYCKWKMFVNRDIILMHSIGEKN